MKKLSESRLNLINKRYSKGSQVINWLNKIEKRQGDSFRGWGLNVSNLIVLSFSPQNVILVNNPSVNFTTFTLVKNLIGRFTALNLIPFNGTVAIATTAVGTSGSTTVTFNVLNSALSYNQFRVVVTSQTSRKITISSINCTYPWGITQKYPSILLPMTTNIDQVLRLVVPTTGPSDTILKSLTPLIGDFVIAINTQATTAQNSGNLCIGISSDLVGNGTSYTNMVNDGINGVFIAINSGRIFINKVEVTALSGWSTNGVYPSKVIIASVSNLIYFGTSVTNMWNSGITPAQWLSPNRYLSIVVNSLTTVESILNLKMTDG
jgi:hypothetical protein